VAALLAGCISAYEPALMTTPKDPAKLEADREACIAEAKEARNRAGPGIVSSTLSGTLGRLSPSQDANDPSTYRGQTKIIDECMAQRGYNVYGTQR
jgi:hypothetical protein